MKEVRGRWISHREEAQIRLASWGAIMRGMALRMGPSLNPYSQQPFLSDRVDGDTMRDMLDQNERIDKALQTDEWMNRIRTTAPNHYIAAVIVYVLYPWKHQFDKRLAEWKKETGLKGQTRFYECLRAVEADIAIQISLTEAFTDEDPPST